MKFAQVPPCTLGCPLDVVALPRLDDRGAVIDSVPSDKRRQIVEGIADRVPDRMDDRACLAHRMAHGNILPVVDVLRDRMTCEDLLLCLAHLDLARGPGACGIERLTRSRIIGMSRCELRDGLVGQVERPEHQGPMTLAGNHAPQIFQKDRILREQHLVASLVSSADLVKPIHLLFFRVELGPEEVNP